MTSFLVCHGGVRVTAEQGRFVATFKEWGSVFKERRLSLKKIPYHVLDIIH